MSIYLIGFRGAGKSTIGAALAQRWSLDFLDLDQKFESMHGSILSFVEKNGIHAFRIEEYRILNETKLLNYSVIATGGGVVDFEASRIFLESSTAPKVYLEADLGLIWQRLADLEKRKVLDIQTYEQMAQLFRTREPFYHKIATFQVHSQDITHALSQLEKLRAELWQAAP